MFSAVTMTDRSEGMFIYSKMGVFLCYFLGVVVMCTVASLHAYYMYMLHENNMWFSNIRVCTPLLMSTGGVLYLYV